MCRRILSLAFLAVACGRVCRREQPALGGHGGELIPETVAAQHGLTRPWFAQVGSTRVKGDSAI